MATDQLIVAGQGAGGADGTGLAFIAPEGTTVPTDALTALNVAFVNGGKITEDGLTAKFDKSVKEIKCFGSTQIQRVLVTEEKTTFDIAFLQTTAAAVAVYSNKALSDVSADVTGAMATTYGHSAAVRYAVVFEVIDGGNHVRFVCPSVEVSARKERKIAAGEADIRGVTFTAYPDAAGYACYEYIIVAALAA
jgi:hypothetical protein